MSESDVPRYDRRTVVRHADAVLCCVAVVPRAARTHSVLLVMQLLLDVQRGTLPAHGHCARVRHWTPTSLQLRRYWLGSVNAAHSSLLSVGRVGQKHTMNFVSRDLSKTLVKNCQVRYSASCKLLSVFLLKGN